MHGRGKANAKSFIHCFNLRRIHTLVLRKKDSPKWNRGNLFTTLIPYQGHLLLAGGDFLPPMTLKMVMKIGDGALGIKVISKHGGVWSRLRSQAN